MPYARGRLIVIEGGDSSGKTTQAALLAEALASKDKKVTSFEFPRYRKSVFADLTTRCIKGEFGDFRTLSPYLASLPYMLDRVRAKNALIEALIDGHVICDRYTTSNVVYQAAKLPEKEQSDFISFIEQAEYGELGLPMPNLVIYLNVTVAAALKSYTGDPGKPTFLYPKGNKYDDEQNVDYQQKVVDLYRRFSQKRINWYVIDCMEQGKLLSAKEINDKILKIVEKYLNIK